MVRSPSWRRRQKPDEALLRQAFDRDFLAEHGGESGIQPSVGMTHGPCRWQLVSAVRDIVDLARVCGPKDFAAAYLWAEIDMAAETKGLLGVGSDDAVKLWLNGHLVHENWASRGLVKDQDVVPVTFSKGRNRLLAKVQNGTSSWGFCCRLLGPAAIKDALLLAAGKATRMLSKPCWRTRPMRMVETLKARPLCTTPLATAAGRPSSCCWPPTRRSTRRRLTV